MPRTVNFEGNPISEMKLPPNCLFIKGVWYSSADKLPSELKAVYAPVFAQHTAKIKAVKEKSEALKKMVAAPAKPTPVPEAVDKEVTPPVEKNHSK
jgi:hypothetical protein